MATEPIKFPELHCIITKIIIKFLYDAHSDWLKQRALSENNVLGFVFVIGNLDKFDPN